MANDCTFSFSAWGKKEDIEEMTRAMRYETDICFYRIFEFSPDISECGDGTDCCCRTWGSCAWSVYSCLFDIGEPRPTRVNNKPAMQVNFLDFCKDHNIIFEIWSEEPGCAFIEHFSWDNEYFVSEDSGAVWWSDDVADLLEEQGYNIDGYSDWAVADCIEDAQNILAMNIYECKFDDLDMDQKQTINNSIDNMDWDLIRRYCRENY